MEKSRGMRDGDPHGLGRIPPIPTWIPPHEADPRHPLELISPKNDDSMNSTFGNRADTDDQAALRAKSSGR